MVKKIVRDQFFLQQKSEPATEKDKQVVEDLLDTLRANQDRCVGMAANMIGVKNQQIIKAPVVRNGKKSTLGYQPDVWKKWE